MKKNVFYSVVALFMMLFVASCSQDEIVSVGQPGDGVVRLSVKVPAATPNTRAVIDVEGYTMRCIMEILDAEGTRIGDQYTADVNMADGSATFEFEKPDGATTYLFWADYVDANSQSYYTATDLTNITYRQNRNNGLFNNLAMDAFCASVGDANLGSGVTLKRPLTRIAVRASDVADLGIEGLNLILPQMRSGQGYNVSTGEVTAEANLRTSPLTEDSPNSGTIPVLTEGEFVFFCYVFPAVATEDATSTIKFSSADNETGHTLEIAIEDMQNLTGNTSVSLKNEGGEDPDPDPEPETTTVRVEIDNAYDDGSNPGTGAEPVVWNVGDYINAAGEKVDASSAVAVVFAKADGVTDDSNYGEGKTAAAYAVSLTFATASRTYATNYLSMNLATTAEGSYVGYAFTQAIDEARAEGTDYRQLDNFFNRNQAPELSGDKVSGWYIPSLAQLQAVADITDATLTATLQGGHTSDYSLATSSVVLYNETEHRLQGVVVTQATGEISEDTNTLQESTSFHILPVVTIFE